MRPSKIRGHLIVAAAWGWGTARAAGREVPARVSSTRERMVGVCILKGQRGGIDIERGTPT